MRIGLIYSAQPPKPAYAPSLCFESREEAL